MAVANLICRYTLPDNIVLTAEFICGDSPVTHPDADAIVRCDEFVVRNSDSDCDEVRATADRMIFDAVEQSHGRFPDFDDMNAHLVGWLMHHREGAALSAHEEDDG